MARPTRDGIDYFPMDVDADEEDKMYMVTAELGEIAFGRIVKLWAAIYRDKGYYKVWDEDAVLVFSGKKQIPIEEVKQLVNTALKRGLFDKEMYDKYEILTSHGMQKRYVKACEGRKQIRIEGEYCLIDPDSCSEKVQKKLNIVLPDKTTEKEQNNGVIPDKTQQEEQNNGVIPGTTPQKKRKEKKRKENYGAGETVLNSPKNDLYERFVKVRDHYNKTRLPKYRYGPENCGRLQEITPTFDANTDEEMFEAIDNYEFIYFDPDYEANPTYPSGFIGLLRPGQGVDLYKNEADPWTRCRKPGVQVQRKGKSKQKPPPESCDVCGGDIKQSLSVCRCTGCGALWEYQGEDWVKQNTGQEAKV